MKKPRSLIPFVAIFVAGFLAGVVFSAWKLESFGDRTVSPVSDRGPQQSGQSDLQARIEAIERMLAVNPKQVDALIQLGNDYFDLGNHDKAIVAYQKALLINPMNADVLTDLGISYRRSGKAQHAAKAFRKAHEVDPNHTVSLFNLGIVLRDDLKDPAEALKAWEEFLKQAPDSPHAVMVRPWVKQLQEKLGQASETTGSGSKQ
ncbi:MAG: tetratricopeptide repeat protein [Desulfomonile tiedjei]|nr:tetratricopeptide repeat protein [Desulfomonile tiedjei]